MKRRVLGMALIVALVAIIAVGATLAYFTDTTQAVKNTFTMGDVDITLTEEVDAIATQSADGYTYTGVMPGVEMVKKPIVTNVGPNEAWIRVNVTVTKAAAWKAALGEGADLTTVFGGYVDADWTRASIKEEGDTITYSYYLNDALAHGESAVLFDSVTVPATFDNDELEAIAGFEISITADAIQTAELPTVEAAFAAFDAE